MSKTITERFKAGYGNGRRVEQAGDTVTDTRRRESVIEDSTATGVFGLSSGTNPTTGPDCDWAEISCLVYHSGRSRDSVGSGGEPTDPAQLYTSPHNLYQNSTGIQNVKQKIDGYLKTSGRKFPYDTKFFLTNPTPQYKLVGGAQSRVVIEHEIRLGLGRKRQAKTGNEKRKGVYSMCLATVTSERYRTEEELTFWKVVDASSKRRFRPLIWLYAHEKQKFGTEIDACADDPIRADDGAQYQAGFHGFAEKEHAEEWMNNGVIIRGSTVVECAIPVGAWVQHGTHHVSDSGRTVPAIVASRIIVHRPAENEQKAEGV